MQPGHAELQMFTRVQSTLPLRSAYTLDDLALALGRSKKTAYRHLQQLKRMGFVIASHEGVFTLRDSVFLPPSVIPKILPSLLAISQERKLRLRNGDPGIERARHLLMALGGFPTLDYAAYELTGYQTPITFYFYPDSLEQAIKILRENAYVESPRGSVILLPKTGDFSDPIQRVFYDSLAVGGRGILDAIAIARKFPKETGSTEYLYSLLNMALKVEQDIGGSDRLVSSRGMRGD
jgi:DNA-binding transcriptional ArsR family regulator